MAAVTREKRVGNPAEEEILSGLLIRRERVVEPPDRIGRIGDLEREIGEGLHLIRRQLINPAVQALERDVELQERYIFIERPGVRLRARRGVVEPGAAPVHRSMIVQSSQALGRHWSLHRPEVDADGRAGLSGSYGEDSVVRDLGIV